MSGLPVRGAFHHAAVVVSSLADSVDFYQRCFGGEVEYVEGVGGAEMAALHGLPSANFDLAFLDYGNARIELFQFHEPAAPEAASVPAHQIGAAHVAFEVDDVEAAYADLVAAGVEFSRPPLAPTEGPAAGFHLAFCFDPDGNRIEIIAPPREEPSASRPAKLVELQIADQDGRETFLGMMEKVLSATGAEPGAEAFVLHHVEDDPLHFYIYERYVDPAAAESHHHQPELGELLGSLKPLLAEPPRMVDLTTLTVARG
jgi:catechol 2,3-dioxygenase-like lactoylglutathione lyase family enzyme/quinol monooxygenase YgiN